ncbi:MAG: hypothetical protein LJF04_16575 [Gemmatimonadetes bacterium]|nr:hypothetical protein [Gemmatimonadota bacterium]
MTAHRPARWWLLATLLALGSPLAVRAQSTEGWTPAMVGIRFGYLDRSTASVLGAQLRIPVIRQGYVELVPNGDITFLRGLKEYQYGLEVAYISGGRHGGLMLGAGTVARNSIFDQGSVRETRKGWDLVVGLKTMPGRGIPFGIQLQERWEFLRVPVNPRVLSLGVNFPLWGWGRFRD